MTKSEILNEIKTRNLAIAGIMDQIVLEKRELTNVEKITLDATKEEIKNFEADLKNEEKRQIIAGVKIENKPSDNFSLIASIRDLAEGRQMSEATLAMNEKGKKAFAGSGLNQRGQIILPFETRGEILAGTQYSGQEIVAEDKTALIVGLRANSVLFKAGAQLLSGLVGDVSIPVYTNSSVNWKGETTIATDGAGSFSEVTLSPKRLTGFIDISKQFLLQDSISANAMLQADLLAAISSKLEYTILQAASGNTDQPAGLFYGASYTSTGATSFAKVVALESAVNTSNALMGNLSYVTTPALKGTMKTTAKATNAAVFVQEAESVNGYPVLVSSNVASGKMIFGNWADLIVGQWAGLDITVDPYSQAVYGKVRLVVNAYFDAKVRRATSFAYANLT